MAMTLLRSRRARTAGNRSDPTLSNHGPPNPQRAALRGDCNIICGPDPRGKHRSRQDWVREQEKAGHLLSADGLGRGRLAEHHRGLANGAKGQGRCLAFEWGARGASGYQNTRVGEAFGARVPVRRAQRMPRRGEGQPYSSRAPSPLAPTISPSPSQPECQCPAKDPEGCVFGNTVVLISQRENDEHECVNVAAEPPLLMDETSRRGAKRKGAARSECLEIAAAAAAGQAKN